MKRFVTSIIFILKIFSVHAQVDKVLLQRLDTVLLATQHSDFSTILDYTYPKLYSIVPRGKLLDVLKEAMETEDFSTTLDSVNIIKISPVINIGDASYAKIQHSMIMRMKFKKTIDSGDEEGNDMVFKMMESVFGKENVPLEIKSNTIHVHSIGLLIAIKDEFAKNWCFVNFDESENSPITTLLFSIEVLNKFKTLN